MNRIHVGIAIIIFLAFLYLGYQNIQLSKDNSQLREELSDTQIKYASTTEVLEGVITDLDLAKDENTEKTQRLQDTVNVLHDVQGDLQTAEDDLALEKAKVGNIAEQVQMITDVVGTLEKLSNTDEELLQKYSKVFFLNEHYAPTALNPIDSVYVYDDQKRYWVHGQILPYLEDLLMFAEQEGIDLQIISAYRSFYSQGILKSSYTVTYGSGANQFSADQGYSEHQLGTTVDFTTEAIGNTFEGFENTSSFEWLKQNAHKYGFVLSYEENNAFYEFEPWHWRYVGIVLATKLYEDGAHFYDLEQREINNYLISFFDGEGE